MLALNEDKPIAVRKLIRLPNGTMGVAFVDPRTGKQIQDNSQYNIVDSGEVVSLEDLNLDVSKSDEGPKEETVAKEIIKDDNRSSSMDVADSPGSSRPDITNTGTGFNIDRSADNAFGYKGKPMAFSVASAVTPGILGLGAKAISVGSNVNNMAAENAARKSWGMEKQGLGGTLRDVAFGTNEVAGISLKDQDNISFFDAMNKPNQDPNVPSPSTKDMSAYSVAEKNAPQSVVGKLGNAVKDFASSLFGGKKQTEEQQLGLDTQTYAGKDFFPDAPEQPTTATGFAASATGNANSPNARGDNTGGGFEGSDQADAARDSPGMY